MLIVSNVLPSSARCACSAHRFTSNVLCAMQVGAGRCMQCPHGLLLIVATSSFLVDQLVDLYSKFASCE